MSYHGALVGIGMRSKRAASLVVRIFTQKDNMNCSCYGAVTLLEYGMKVVERALERTFHKMMTSSKTKFCFMFE